MIVSPRSVGKTRPRFGAWAWVGAVAVHLGIFAALQFGSAPPARSSIPMPPASEAIRIQAMDAEILRQRRAEHQQALRELERARQREAQAKEAERQRVLRQAAERKRREAERQAERKRAEEERRRREAAMRPGRRSVN